MRTIYPSPLRLCPTTRTTDLQAAAPRERIQRAVLDAACRDQLQYLFLHTIRASLLRSCFQYGLNKFVLQARGNTWLILLFAQVVPWCIRHHLKGNRHVANLTN
jgi:hypothetical protein